MVIGVTFMIIAILIIAIWILIELKRLRHKIFAIFLIALILFLYISITFTLKGQDIDFGTSEGMIRASKIYFAWLGSAFENIKSITTNAINMDWSTKNSSIGK